MFDIGFSELLIIAVVALLVIGPERLPKAARTLGHLFGRMQRYVNDVKADISREMELDELRKLQASMQEAARSFEGSVSKELNETGTEFRKFTEDVPTGAPQSSPESAPTGAPQSSPESVSTAAASNQLELGLEGAAQPAERKPG